MSKEDSFVLNHKLWASGKNIKIVRTCIVCGDDTENEREILCKRCKQAILYARTLMENQGDREVG